MNPHFKIVATAYLIMFMGLATVCFGLQLLVESGAFDYVANFMKGIV